MHASLFGPVALPQFVLSDCVRVAGVMSSCQNRWWLPQERASCILQTALRSKLQLRSAGRCFVESPLGCHQPHHCPIVTGPSLHAAVACVASGAHFFFFTSAPPTAGKAPCCSSCYSRTIRLSMWLRRHCARSASTPACALDADVEVREIRRARTPVVHRSPLNIIPVRLGEGHRGICTYLFPTM